MSQESQEFKMMPRHWAMLSTLITTVVAIATFLVLWGLKNPVEPKMLGSFEVYGVKTTIFQAGDCQINVSKFPKHEEPRFFFSCPQKR